MTELPEELQPIVHDVNRCSPVRVVVREPPVRDRSGSALWVRVAGASGAIGFVPQPGAALVERTFTQADQVHDWVLECLPELGFPAVWPECPEHPGTHPLGVVLRDGVVVWACPRSGTVHARVGGLGG
ncbi:hypothetical protein [Actinoplanes siamensis]|nr:hypothetical protein [Actinoplanes siamensis]